MVGAGVSSVIASARATDPTQKRKTPLPGESGASGRDVPQWEMGGPTSAISRDAAAAVRRDGGRIAVVHASHIHDNWGVDEN